MAWYLPVGLNFADGLTPLNPQPYGSIGNNAIVGTKLPTADLSIFSNSLNGVISIEEPPGSPDIERAEQCTCSHTLRMSWNEALNYWTLMPRGTIVNDTGANIWRVLSCRVRRLEGTTAELYYVMESISFDSPPDDFQLNEVSLDMNILKHPRYNWAFSPYVTDVSTYKQVGDTKVFYTDLKQAVIRMIQVYIDTPMYPSADYVNGQIQNNVLSQISDGKLSITVPNPNYVPLLGMVLPGLSQQSWNWDGTNASLAKIPPYIRSLTLQVPVDLNNPSDPVAILIAAAKEVLAKLWRQEDTPYIAGYEVVWTQYFFAPVYLNPGGYIEDPRNWIPGYFMNPFDGGTKIPRAIQTKPGTPIGPIGGNGGGNQDSSAAPTDSGDSIFDSLPFINPQCYSTTGLKGGPLSMSCLRKSDHYDYERTWFKVAHTWLCAPVGKWDADLYTQKNRPQVATDYNQLPEDQTYL